MRRLVASFVQAGAFLALRWPLAYAVSADAASESPCIECDLSSQGSFDHIVAEFELLRFIALAGKRHDE